MAGELSRLLVANRGEVACRVFRAARTLGIETVGVRSTDDDASLHTRRCDHLEVLPGTGPAAYLDIAAVLAAVDRSGATAVHPGYGFLSESADLARACADAGVLFVGPSPEALDLLGDKGRSRRLADQCGVPLLAGTEARTSVDEMREFWDRECAGDPDAAVMVKAVSGGGGRGVRVVRNRADLDRAHAACAAEARHAFGDDSLYIERFLPAARHVEVQLIGDADGSVAHLWDRDCSLQRRHQKLIEVAPSRVLQPGPRAELLDAAVGLGRAAGLVGLATVEFLALADGRYFFLEVNPRLQVEHTVTEEVLGLDLVSLQIRVATGATLTSLGVDQASVPAPRGHAVQLRINGERALAGGDAVPVTGTLTDFDLPVGAGVRVEAAGYRGLAMSPHYDSLLAKIIVHGADPDDVVRLAAAALGETRIGGLESNVQLLASILDHPDFIAGVCDTAWIEHHAEELLTGTAGGSQGPDRSDSATGDLRAGFGAVIVDVLAQPGDVVRAGDLVMVLEAMKMQYPVEASIPGTVMTVPVVKGETVSDGQVLLTFDPSGSQDGGDVGAAADVDLNRLRPELERLLDQRRVRLDESRPAAIARRHAAGGRTARENVAAVTDDGLVVEYGGFAVAAQSRIRDRADLEARTPADGLVTGLGRVNGDLFADDLSMCALLAYDYTVMAGTQGYYSHKKADRLLEVARKRKHPVILFAEGGGGRPNDTDVPVIAGLHYGTFAAMGSLSGTVPTIGVASGRCFAGNAALLGTCDVVIATQNSSIGMGGPAMVEGGGLGTFTPEEIGPLAVQSTNGVVDVAVADELEAAAIARRYLSYFQGHTTTYEAPDERLLRLVVPEDRKRAYDVRSAIEGIVDVGSILELRAGFGRAAVTALARIEGRPIGVIANQPYVNGGAIDADAADKLARFLNLCDNYAIPVLSLCDTPGFMVGPASERQATVRHFPRLFVLGGHITVPTVTVVLRKAYGLGALAMAAGGFHNTSLTVGWPTGELGGMGIEGAVRLGAREHLAAIDDPDERRRQFDEMVAFAYEQGSAVNAARHLELDEVIDPADTRAVVAATLLGRPGPSRTGWVNSERRVGLDTW
jgi:acetyl/propionyl-CoA carboxylase alpha subunit/acetyl-CoA carboxylase carboxyltransferase component